MRKNSFIWIALALAAATAAVAQTEAAAPATYVGAEACLECHSEVADALGPHGAPGFGKLSDHGCETCHGPGSLHVDDPEVVANRPTLTGKSADEKSAICQTCHNGRAQFFWSGSTHQTRNVACTDCHSVHSPKSEDAQLVATNMLEQCFSCHKNIRADLWKNSHHQSGGELPQPDDLRQHEAADGGQSDHRQQPSLQPGVPRLPCGDPRQQPSLESVPRVLGDTTCAHTHHFA